VKGLLKLIREEFRKLHRRPLLILATLASIILPIPVSVLASRTGQGYDYLFKIVIQIGHFILLIPVLCVIASLLFFEERDNHTLRLLSIVPVSFSRLAWAKMTVLLIVSIAYSVFTYTATLIGAVLGGMPVEKPVQKLFLCLVMGIMTWAAAFPCVAILVKLSKNYIFSVLFSFLYSISGFILTNATMPEPSPNLFMVLPVNVISRWLLPVLSELDTAKYLFDIGPSAVSTPVCVLYLAVCLILFGALLCRSFCKWKEL